VGVLAVDEVMLREPRLLVPGRQPQSVMKIDWTHPLARGLCVFVLPKQGDLVTGLRPSYGGTASLKPKSNALSFQSENNNNDLAYFPFPASAPLYTITSAHTTMLWFEHTSSANYANFLSVPYAAGIWAYPYNSLVLYKNTNASNVWQYQIGNITAYPLVASSAAVSTANRCVIAGHSGPNTAAMYVDGANVSTTVSNGNWIVNWNTKQPLCLLASSDSYSVNAGVTGNAFCAAVWNRQLSAIEAAEMYRNPYQFLIPA
jgi:hypothetical protein